MRRSVSARWASRARFAWPGDDAGPRANNLESKPEYRRGCWCGAAMNGSFSISDPPVTGGLFGGFGVAMFVNARRTITPGLGQE